MSDRYSTAAIDRFFPEGPGVGRIFTSNGSPDGINIRDLHRCVLDFEAESRVRFDPSSIVHHLLQCRLREQVTATADITQMIKFYVQGGHDLEYLLQKALTPEIANRLRGLIRKYGLTTNATCSHSVTLFRVGSSFPDKTCAYLLETPDMLISVQILRLFIGPSVANIYPKTMMDCAFALLIPYRTERYCLLLKRAHMVYRYVLYYLSRRLPADDDVALISQCIRHTRVAICSTHLPFEVQMQFLLNYRLVSVVNSQYVVSNAVRVAASFWTKKIRPLDVLTQLIDDESDYWIINESHDLGYYNNLYVN